MNALNYQPIIRTALSTATPAAQQQLPTASVSSRSGIAEALSKMPWYVKAVWWGISAACAYHGYRRNRSLVSAIGWGVAGTLLPVIAFPVALAQGFGKQKKRKR